MVKGILFAADFISANKSSVVSKNESCGNVFYQTNKLGTQSRLYEQNYSQMIFAI